MRLGIGEEFLKSRTPEEISTASGYAGGPTIFFWHRSRERNQDFSRSENPFVSYRRIPTVASEKRIQMLPVPQTNSVASQECVGEHAEDGQMATNDVAAEDELARGVGAERMERAPLHYVQGRRWSPGVYRSLRLLGKPLQVAWERAFFALPTF